MRKHAKMESGIRKEKKRELIERERPVLGLRASFGSLINNFETNGLVKSARFEFGWIVYHSNHVQ